MATLALSYESVWLDKWRYDEAECDFYEKKFGVSSSGLGSLASQIAKARQEIHNTLASSGCGAVKGGNQEQSSSIGRKKPTSYGGHVAAASGGQADASALNRLTKLEKEHASLHSTVTSLENAVEELTRKLASLECGQTTLTSPSVAPTAAVARKSSKETKDEDENDDVDLFGSDDDEEDEEAARVREERLKAYADKKSKKPGPIAKSSVLLDCKPWADDTDLKAMEREIRQIEMDGLTWGASKLVEVAFGIQKLCIMCTVEDEKVSIDDLTEKICEIEEYVQSVDIAAFNKI